jgi:hypothetical protein
LGEIFRNTSGDFDFMGDDCIVTPSNMNGFEGNSGREGGKPFL